MNRRAISGKETVSRILYQSQKFLTVFSTMVEKTGEKRGQATFYLPVKFIQGYICEA